MSFFPDKARQSKKHNQKTLLCSTDNKVYLQGCGAQKSGVIKVGLQTRAKSVILSFFAPSLAAFSLSCCFCFPQGTKNCLSAFFMPFSVKGCEKKKFPSERLLRQFSPSRFKFEFWTEKAILPSADVGRNEATPLSQPFYVDRVLISIFSIA